MPWYSQCSWCGGPFNGGNCRRCTNMSFGEEFVRNPDPISNDETPEFSYPPSQPQYESNSCEKCGNDSHYGYDCSPRFPLGSYIPWASRFRRYLNQKRDNRKWLLKALDEGPYVFKNFIPEGSTIPRLQTAEDLEGDDLLLHDAEMEVMNMILLSIPNEIYNSVDACTSAKDMWKRVERLIAAGTFTKTKLTVKHVYTNDLINMFAEPGEAIVSVDKVLLNDNVFERNKLEFANRDN
ncbi:hypothetical protein Tco_1202783 [Tanacetum coccineum]